MSLDKKSAAVSHTQTGPGEVFEAPGPRRRKPTVTLLGQDPRPSNPAAALGRALRRSGIESRPDRPVSLRRRSLGGPWDSDVYVVTAYRRLPLGKVAKLAYGILRGRAVIRWWVGTDVLRCLEDVHEARFARRLDRLVSMNLAASPLLKDELAALGIETSVIPSPVDTDRLDAARHDGPPPRAILAYLPTHSRAFYGEEIVRRALARHPDLPFLIVGCDDPNLFREFPNATNLGEVREMAPVYARAGCLLRVTRHDGLPRMVLEALLLRKYVIFSQPLPGCWLADDHDQVEACIRRFLDVQAPNDQGRDEALRLLSPAPALRLAEAVERSCLPVPLRKRVERLVGALALCWLALAWTLRERLAARTGLVQRGPRHEPWRGSPESFSAGSHASCKTRAPTATSTRPCEP